MRSTPEQIVLVAPVPASALPLQIFDLVGESRQLARIARECRWVVVTHIPEDSEGQEAYALYFVDGEGWPGDKDFFDSLEEVVAYAESRAGVRSSTWSQVSTRREEPHGFSRFPLDLLHGSRHKG